MELILENPKSHNPVSNRIEALKALAKLLLHEVETLAEISPNTSSLLKDTEINLTEEIQRYEADLICNALFAVNGNQRKAAKMLGMKNSTLNAKIKRYEIDSLSVRGKLSSTV
jgi:transcriptional regulator with GAF, ATPase, and Fis domain